MAVFDANLTDTLTLDDSTIALYDQSFLIEAEQTASMDPVTTIERQIGATSIAITKYGALADATTPLTETDDTDSVKMADTKIVLTPVEYGNVVTLTKQSIIQSGGKVSLATTAGIGQNAGNTMNKLACLALDASANSYIIGGTAAGSVAATQVANRAFFNYFYNKLERKGVPTINGKYYACVHPDVIADLREDTAVGSWYDLNKFSNPGEVVGNIVGEFAGFYILPNSRATFGDQTGSGTVDLYNTYFLGFNGLGKAVNQDLTLTFNESRSKQKRFVDIGWLASVDYSIVDTDAVWVGKSASSKGANAA